MGKDSSMPKPMGDPAISPYPVVGSEIVVPSQSATKWDQLQGSLGLSDKVKISGFAKTKHIINVENVGYTLAERVDEEFGYGMVFPPSSTGTLPIVQARGAPMSGVFKGWDNNDKFRHYAGKYWAFDAETTEGSELYQQMIKNAIGAGLSAALGGAYEAETGAQGPTLLPTTLFSVKFLNPVLGNQPSIINSPFESIIVGPTVVSDLDSSESPLATFKSISEVVAVASTNSAAPPGLGWSNTSGTEVGGGASQENVIVSEAGGGGGGSPGGGPMSGPGAAPGTPDVLKSAMMKDGPTSGGIAPAAAEQGLEGWNDKTWSIFINGKYSGKEHSLPWSNVIELNEEFVDCPFEISCPFHENEISNIETRKNCFMKLEPVYNYYISEYEELVSNLDWLKESVIPNIQVISAIHDGIQPGNFKNLVFAGSVTHLLKPFSKSTFVLGQAGNSIDPVKIGGNYFKKFAKDMKKLSEATMLAAENGDTSTITSTQQTQLDSIVALEKEFSNIVIPYFDMDLLKNAEDKKHMFPMYFNLEFSTDIATEFTDILRATPFGIQLMIRIVKDIVEYGGYNFPSPQKFWAAILSEVSFLKPNEIGDPTYEKRVTAEGKGVRQWDLEKWLVGSGILNWESGVIDKTLIDKIIAYESDFTFLSKNYSKKQFDKELKTLTGIGETSGAFSQIISSIIFKKKFIDFVHDKFRTFKHILIGTPAYSETILYRIQKTPWSSPGSSGTGYLSSLPNFQHQQNIWIPNTNDLDIVKYLDTQVKYGVEYHYEIFAYQLVVGTRYSYGSESPKALTSAVQTPGETAKGIAGHWAGSALTPTLMNTYSVGSGATGSAQPGEESLQEAGVMEETWQLAYNESLNSTGQTPDGSPVTLPGECWVGKKTSGQHAAVFRVNSYPMVKLIEVPYGKMVGKIIDHPPIAPEIDIIPYHGVNNRLLININGGLGEYKAKPVFIETDDNERVHEHIDIATGLVHYKNDDSASNSGYFEIYRTNTMPLSYDDFKGKRLAIADPESFLEVQQMGVSTASYLDAQIVPNQTYWYTFRTIDVHGNLSNPSAVYQIEIVDDKRSIYMLNKIFEFPPETKNIKTVPMKKYLQIEPAYLQSIMKKDFSIPLIEDNAEKILSEVVLGSRDKGLWGKKFKIRLTSRQTGRKIDLNLGFQLKRYNRHGKFVEGIESLTNPNK